MKYFYAIHPNIPFHTCNAKDQRKISLTFSILNSPRKSLSIAQSWIKKLQTPSWLEEGKKKRTRREIKWRTVGIVVRPVKIRLVKGYWHGSSCVFQFIRDTYIYTHTHERCSTKKEGKNTRRKKEKKECAQNDR